MSLAEILLLIGVIASFIPGSESWRTFNDWLLVVTLVACLIEIGPLLRRWRRRKRAD